MDEKNNERNNGLQLELPQEVAQGEYANFAIITHSSSDFIVDFARVLPGVPKAQVKSRVILAPEHANIQMNPEQRLVAHGVERTVERLVVFVLQGRRSLGPQAAR